MPHSNGSASDVADARASDDRASDDPMPDGPNAAARAPDVSGSSPASSEEALTAWGASAEPAPPRWRVWLRLLSLRTHHWSPTRMVLSVLVVLVFAGSLWTIAHEFRGFEYAEVGQYLSDLPILYVGTAVCITLTNFVVLSGYDALALKYVDADLSGRRIAFSAFVGYAVSQAIGNPILTGGSVRYRLYTAWGLSPGQIAKCVVFAGTSFWLGFFTLGSVLFLFEPVALPPSLDLPVAPQVIGAVCLLPMVGYLGVTFWRTEPLTVRGWTLPVPPQWMLPVQVGLAALDLILATTVLYILLPPTASVSFLYLLGVYLVALLAGLVSHVPGGLGVFDSIVLLMLTPVLPAPTVLGGLLAYRGIFHLFPLLLALLAFGAYEARSRWGDSVLS